MIWLITTSVGCLGCCNGTFRAYRAVYCMADTDCCIGKSAIYVSKIGEIDQYYKGKAKIFRGR